MLLKTQGQSHSAAERITLHEQFYENLFSMKLWIKLNAAGYSQNIWIFPQKMFVARTVITCLSPALWGWQLSATTSFIHLKWQRKMGEYHLKKLRIRTPADVWGLIYIIVFQIFSLHLMSNALSNWKISENYKKSNLTWNGRIPENYVDCGCIFPVWESFDDSW